MTEVIGAYVSTLVNDGDTIQIGTGTLSSCMGGYLTEKRDLGIDSEILVAVGGRAGQVRRRHRPLQDVPSRRGDGSLHRARRRLRVLPRQSGRRSCFDIEWVNNLPRIAAIRNLVAINQASVIDLTGQVASESIGAAMYTGPGRPADVDDGRAVRAAAAAPFTSCRRPRATAPSRASSPQHAPGTVVTVPRTFVDFVVTEHGIANLQGLSQRERALALIELAAPQFRAQLRAEARRLFWP